MPQHAAAADYAVRAEHAAWMAADCNPIRLAVERRSSRYFPRKQFVRRTLLLRSGLLVAEDGPVDAGTYPSQPRSQVPSIFASAEQTDVYFTVGQWGMGQDPQFPVQPERGV